MCARTCEKGPLSLGTSSHWVLGGERGVGEGAGHGKQGRCGGLAAMQRGARTLLCARGGRCCTRCSSSCATTPRTTTAATWSGSSSGSSSSAPRWACLRSWARSAWSARAATGPARPRRRRPRSNSAPAAARGAGLGRQAREPGRSPCRVPHRRPRLLTPRPGWGGPAAAWARRPRGR